MDEIKIKKKIIKYPIASFYSFINFFLIWSAI